MSTIYKDIALNIASKAWIERIKPSNLISGFRTAGLYPLNLLQMSKRLAMFQQGGVKPSYVHASWLKRKSEIQTEVLFLPPQTPRKKLRKTIDVAGRILTISLLDEVDKTKEEQKSAAAAAKSLKASQATKAKKRPKNVLSNTNVTHEVLV